MSTGARRALGWTMRIAPGRAKPGSGGRVAFGLYMAALDAEEQAAEVYAGLVRRADKLSWSERPPAEPLGGPAWGDGWP